MISKRKYHLIFTLCFLSFGIIIALLTSIVNYKSSFTDVDLNFQETANEEVLQKQELLSSNIDHFHHLLSSILESHFTKLYMESRQVGDKDDLTTVFLALASSNQNIMQLRYLDPMGKEVIRVDREKNKNGGVHVIADDKMQNKYHRSYFQETKRLTAGQYWYSSVDLNMEHGKVEIPYVPTFRVATPIIAAGEFKGILIVNLLFDKIIKRLAYSETFHVYLVDTDGEVIYSPESGGSWSRYDESVLDSLTLFPEHKAFIGKEDRYDSRAFYARTLMMKEKEGRTLQLLFIPKLEVLSSIKDKNISTAWIIALTVLIVSIPLSWTISFIPSKLQTELSDAYHKIHKSSKIIDQHVMLSTIDENGVITGVSDHFLKLTGYKKEEIIGTQYDLLKHPDMDLSVINDRWKSAEEDNVWRGEVKNRDKHGTTFWVQQVISAELTGDNKVKGFTSISQDITDKKQIEKISITDNLTGLYNRYKLEEVLNNEVARFSRYKTPFSIVLLDIDFFKKVNDTYGHLIGDEVLIDLSKLLKNNVRNIDIVSRWGGEEFLIVTPETELKNALLFAEKLRVSVEKQVFSTGGSVTISCGVVEYLEDEMLSKSISRADKALYQAKEGGRNQIKAG